MSIIYLYFYILIKNKMEFKKLIDSYCFLLLSYKVGCMLEINMKLKYSKVFLNEENNFNNNYKTSP